jgi:hypothetical protein
VLLTGCARRQTNLSSKFPNAEAKAAKDDRDMP